MTQLQGKWAHCPTSHRSQEFRHISFRRSPWFIKFLQERATLLSVYRWNQQTKEARLGFRWEQPCERPADKPHAAALHSCFIPVILLLWVAIQAPQRSIQVPMRNILCGVATIWWWWRVGNQSGEIKFYYGTLTQWGNSYSEFPIKG